MANLLYNKTGSYVGGMAVYKPKVYFIGHMITALSGGAIYNLNEDVGVFITIAIIILQNITYTNNLGVTLGSDVVFFSVWRSSHL